MTDVRVAIISFEHMHAFSYAHSFHNMPGAQMVAAAESDPERLARVKQDYPFIGSVYSDYREMLDREDIDAVIITTANIDHKPVALECAARKKHILCEKPLATTVEDCRAIIEATRSAGVRLMTAFPVPFSPAIREAQQMIRDGRLGRILGASTSNHGSMPGSWFIQKEKSGGGAVMDHTVHVVDLLRRMFQDEVQEVYAEYGTRLHDINIDDVGQLLLRFKSGIIASLDTSWSRPKSYKIWGDVKIDIKGESANAWINCFPTSVNYYDDRTMRHSGSTPGEDLDALMIAEFLCAIRERREPSVTGEDGLRAVQVALAAYEAGETGQVIRLDN